MRSQAGQSTSSCPGSLEGSTLWHRLLATPPAVRQLSVTASRLHPVSLPNFVQQKSITTVIDEGDDNSSLGSLPEDQPGSSTGSSGFHEPGVSRSDECPKTVHPVADFGPAVRSRSQMVQRILTSFHQQLSESSDSGIEERGKRTLSRKKRNQLRSRSVDCLRRTPSPDSSSCRPQSSNSRREYTSLQETGGTTSQLSYNAKYLFLPPKTTVNISPPAEPEISVWRHSTKLPPTNQPVKTNFAPATRMKSSSVPYESHFLPKPNLSSHYTPRERRPIRRVPSVKRQLRPRQEAKRGGLARRQDISGLPKRFFRLSRPNRGPSFYCPSLLSE